MDLKKTLYLISLRGIPAIPLLFDCFDDAKRYVASMDRRRVRHTHAEIIPLTYYPPKIEKNDLIRVKENLKTAINEINHAQSLVNGLAVKLGGG